MSEECIPFRFDQTASKVADQLEPFFVVWSPQGGPPTRRHPDMMAATNEAMRLAKANPGREFIVLRPVRRIAVPPAVIIQDYDMGLTDDEIPF